jgi:FkbM family methyltransferase
MPCWPTRGIRRLRDIKYHKPTRLACLEHASNRLLQCCIAYNKYGGYCIPLSSRHRPAAKKILAGEVWEADTIEFVQSNCGDGDLVHAGTYFGDFLPALSASCKPGAIVWAFEPNVENYRCACITITLNGLKNVRIRNVALGAKHGSLPLQVLDATGQALGGGSQLSEDAAGIDKTSYVAARIVPLDSVVPVQRRVSVAQFDVEGFEKPVIAGALGTIRRWKPIIVLEQLPEGAWLERNLAPLGYGILQRISNNVVLSSE